MSDSARLFVDTKLLLEKAPKQLVIHSPAANNDKLDLPEGVLLDAMSALYEQLEVEGSPAVRAVAGHWLFGHIHPHRDGNGRVEAATLDMAARSSAHGAGERGAGTA